MSTDTDPMATMQAELERLRAARVEPADMFSPAREQAHQVAALGIISGAAVDIALQVDQTRDDTLLGASEAAAVLGLDRYRSPMSVWMAKRAARAGDAPPADKKPAFVHEAAEWGIALEPVIRGKYALATRSEVCVPNKSVALDWLRCTPDGFVIAPGIAYEAEVTEWLAGGVPPSAAGLLQVKTCSAWKAEEWADGVPPAYEVQVRVEMAVCDLPWCDVVCLAGGQRYLGPFRVFRDDTIEAAILRDLRAFWQLVLDGVPPSVDDSEAWSQRAASLMKPSKVVLHADDELRAYLVELRQARAERKRAEKQEAELKTQCLLRLGAAGATIIEGGDLGKLTAYANPARMQWKEYAESLEGSIERLTAMAAAPQVQPGALSALREQFKKPGSGWAIRTPRNWGDEDE